MIIEEDTLIRATFYAAPNPFTDYVNVDFQATTSGSAILYVFDVNNREITAQNITIVEGENGARIQFEQLPRGTFILQLRFNGNTYSKLLIKNKFTLLKKFFCLFFLGDIFSTCADSVLDR